MLKVYVAGMYSADNVLDVLKNIGNGQRTCAYLFSLGFSPFCPWHDKTYVIDRPFASYSVKQFYAHSMAWLEVSDAVFVISGEGKGTGVDKEIKRANELGIPVFRCIDDLLQWKDER